MKILRNSPRGARLSGYFILALIVSASSGCAIIPPVVEHAYTVLSGITYLMTSKSPAEQAVSIASHKDCSFFRILEGRPICVPRTEKSNQTLFATLSDLFEKQPQDLPPAELLKQLPRIVAPAHSPPDQSLLVVSAENYETQPRELAVPEMLKQFPRPARRHVFEDTVAGLR